MEMVDRDGPSEGVVSQGANSLIWWESTGTNRALRERPVTGVAPAFLVMSLWVGYGWIDGALLINHAGAWNQGYILVSVFRPTNRVIVKRTTINTVRKITSLLHELTLVCSLVLIYFWIVCSWTNMFLWLITTFLGKTLKDNKENILKVSP